MRRAVIGWARAQADVLDRLDAEVLEVGTRADAEALRARVAADPNLIRAANDSIATRVTALRVRLDDRITRLTAREAAQADLARAVDAGMPGAVAGASRRARVDGEAGAAADGGASTPPVLAALVQGVLAAAERNDWLAALRGSQQLCLDLYDEPDAVKAALQIGTTDFSRFFTPFPHRFHTT